MPNEDKLCIKHTEQLTNIKEDVGEIKKDIKEVLKLNGKIEVNTNDIDWLRWGIRGLYGSLIIGVMTWIIRGIVKASFF